ncbi:MAG: SDR family NAD(P)-dependent oxidoreductase [Oscillospiraceae bacterium]|nr:SDR family NAD(P)-dependent oxidoreductase [Oscillospiraceae bacterium]MBR0452187.1 SDR family NAD(P)-dependent oxidoreductase [Oscillospiraceae bacterium]
MIAIVTGASSGFGQEFVKQFDGRGYDEIWVIARREDRLVQLKEIVSTPIRPVPMDLSDMDSLSKLKDLLEKEKPVVHALVNASGFGYFNAFTDETLDNALNMIDLNDKALISLCYIVIPYMKEGSEIYNIASSSAFQPVPYIGVYAATKAFVLSFSRSLNQELKKKGIRVIAVCPHWTKTEFFDRADKKNGIITYYNFYTEKTQVVSNSIKHIQKGKDVSLTSLRLKLQALAATILPKSLVMKIWLNSQHL